MEQGNIPFIHVQGKTLPEVWEKSLLELWEKGIPIPTQYDRPNDPQSRDCSATLVIEEPFAEPRIHKSFPAGLEELEVYRQEVVDGVHDYWCKPEEGKWTYTYHQRLFGYIPAMRGKNKEVLTLGMPSTDTNEDGTVASFCIKIDQVQFIIDSLCNVPYSRRSQGITYMPSYDQGTEDPPCLQRIWCRCSHDKDGHLVLNMNTHWRSRDAFKAAFMNIFALTDLQRYIADCMSVKLDRPVLIGRYIDMVDSYHIYGSYFEDFKGFLETCKNRSFESRVWDSHDPMIQDAFEDGKKRLQREKETGEIGMH